MFNINIKKDDLTINDSKIIISELDGYAIDTFTMTSKKIKYDLKKQKIKIWFKYKMYKEKVYTRKVVVPYPINDTITTFKGTSSIDFHPRIRY
ncbi:MAG: hypothetical protein HYR91_13955 [Flavobacteriia bacterium]|nr:hypothetical protein [Flavobacteriia bacterium]